MRYIECGLKYFYRLAWIKKAHDAPGKYEVAHITGDLLFIGRSFTTSCWRQRLLCFSRMPERNHAAQRRSQPAHATERKLYRPRRTHPPNPLGRRRPLANLVSAQFSHDAAGRLAQIRHPKPTAAPWPNTPIQLPARRQGRLTRATEKIGGQGAS